MTGIPQNLNRAIGRIEANLMTMKGEVTDIKNSLDEMDKRLRAVEIRGAVIAATSGAIAAFISWQIFKSLAGS